MNHTAEFAAAIAGASALVLGAGYQVARLGMQPTSQLFGRTAVDGDDPDPACHTVALTYDDGPSPRNTPALLDLLARHGVHATFLLVGTHVRRYPEIARRIVAEGHLVGNHTETHPNLARLRPKTVREELRACQQTIEDVTGITATLFRPPFGARRPDVLRSARALGLVPLLWNVTVRDWEPIGVDHMLRNADKGIEANRERRRTSNILLHDASHLDGREPVSRQTSIQVTAALLARPNLRFTTAERSWHA